MHLRARHLAFLMRGSLPRDGEGVEFRGVDGLCSDLKGMFPHAKSQFSRESEVLLCPVTVCCSLEERIIVHM